MHQVLKPVLCLLGPTASGKSALGVQFSAIYPIEIISVDAAMVYKDMNIGTAKPSIHERQLVAHHLIDIINPTEAFSAAQFCSQAHDLIPAIHQRNKIPLLLGGTMMYFKALQSGLTTLPSANAEIREQLCNRAQKYGWQSLHVELTHCDPSIAAKIHPNDTQRIQRALEIFYLTGQPLSMMHKGHIYTSTYKFIN